MGGFVKNNRVIFIIMAGAILFYLPFISWQFTSDDWLWLANAKMASSDPSIFLQRPMYGYFRPLNMVLVFLMLKLFGVTPWAFSLVNILLHACNIWLLWILLGRFKIPDPIRNLSAFIFGFYALNSSAIEWISVGHDLWVTGLSLLLAILILRLIERPNFASFALCWIVGFMALLIKESGFVTIGIYFSLLILKGNSPFRREFLIYSLIFVVTYFLYLYGYFITRTIAERELDIGIGTLVNLWYFVSYLASPISERIAEGFPARFIWTLKLIKAVTVIAVPAILVFVFVKARTGHRFFIIWSVMFISTIAIIKWDLHPFSLYPERTAARFMYLAVPGMAVTFSWVLMRFFNRPAFKNVYLVMALTALYISGNFMITNRISRLYYNNQVLSTSILEDFGKMQPILAQNDTLIVISKDLQKTPQVVKTGKHLRGILYVALNRDMTVIVVEDGEIPHPPDISRDRETLAVEWDNSKQRFKIPINYGDLPIKNQSEVLHTSNK